MKKTILITLLGAFLILIPSISTAFICGDANSDSDVNLMDILYVVDYLYGNPPGDQPVPVASSDVNADNTVNLLDILYLIDYLYGSPSGPEPDCGPDIGTVTDIDGNIYPTIRIGDQWWMAENLKVTHFSNGDPLDHITDGGIWITLYTGAYCSYDNNDAYVDLYGRLYNAFAAQDERNIAPAGWHVPTNEEWQILVDYLGGEAVAGGKMKEPGTTHWFTPNAGATNESGFSALPGGYCYTNQSYGGLGIGANWWSSTTYGSFGGWAWSIENLYTIISYYHYNPRWGYSIRCVKD